MRFRDRLNQSNVMESKVVATAGGGGDNDQGGAWGIFWAMEMFYLDGGGKCTHMDILKI